MLSSGTPSKTGGFVSSSSGDDVSTVAAHAPQAVAGLRFVVTVGVAFLALDAGAFLGEVLVVGLAIG